MTVRTADDGAIAILVALLSVVLFGFAALVVDIGDAQTVRSQSQNAVDAAALAGVRVLAAAGTPAPVGTDAAVAAAVQSYVSANIGATNWAGCTDPTPLPVPADGSDSCISMSGPSPGLPSYQVRVKLPARHVPATFGGLFGVSSISISPIAQAASGQPQPPECGPCDPVLDEMNQQPKLPAQALVFPDPLPDPNDQALVPPGQIGPFGCPGAGAYQSTNLTIGNGVSCILKPGLYVFNNSNLDVQSGGTLSSFLAVAGDTTGFPANTGVTLVFYGTGTLTVEGNLGPLLASHSDVSLQVGTPATGQPIPGVAIVLDQFTPGSPAPRTFTLGGGFDITGSVYALDGSTTWATNDGDCPAVGPTCSVHDEGPDSAIATTATAFFKETPARIPTIRTPDRPTVPPSLPSPPHLVE